MSASEERHGATPLSAVVVHVVGADVSEERLAVLGALVAEDSLVTEHVVLHLGNGSLSVPAGVKGARVHAPLALGRLGGRALRHALWRRGLLDRGTPVILHAWCPGVVTWCRSLVAGHHPLVVEADAAADVVRLARWSATGALSFVCSSAAGRQRLLQHGVPAARCALIRPWIDLACFDLGRRAAMRAHLKLEQGDTAVLALPPVARATGTFTAAWAAMLAHQARPDVRLVVPAGGREQRRVRRLVEACRRNGMLRFAPADATLPELLVAADLAVYLPRGVAPSASLAGAIAAQRPLVTTLAAVEEIGAGGANIWQCRPDDPEDAARQVLQALASDPTYDGEGGAVGVSGEWCSRGRLLAQYRRVYENVAARRPAAAEPRVSPTQ